MSFAVTTDMNEGGVASSSVWPCERTHGQVGDEEVGDGAERLEPVDDVDDQRVAQDSQPDDGAVG